MSVVVFLGVGFTGVGAGRQPVRGVASAQFTDSARGILFQGRFDMSDRTKPKFAWSGSAVVIRFTGSSVVVRLNANGIRFRADVDGRVSDFIATAATDYPLATGLPAGSHRLVLWRQTEARQGVAQFLGVRFPTGGALDSTPTVPARRVEVIGDSIATGYGNEGLSGCVGYTVGQQNHWLSFGAVAARSKGAGLVTAAWAGKGLYRNYDGTTAATGETMPELYGRTLPTDPTSNWPFISDIPQAVVINLGTNDYRGGDPGTVFNATYLDLIRQVRSHYPAAKILVALTPMLSGANRSSLAVRLKAVVNTMNTVQFDPNVYYLDLTSQGTARGCDNHPNTAHHQVMGTIVAQALGQRLGW